MDPARAGVAACYAALLVHSLGYAGFAIDPATWALLALGARAAGVMATAMFEHLRRLATTGAAYTAASVLSKLIAVFLLPVYTAYLSPAEYGDVEIMIATLVAASIVVRLGVIEAILRFYYLADERPEAVVRTGFASLFWTTSLLAAIAMPLADPISELLLDGRSEPGLMRLTILGLWQLTLWEYALTLLRLDERARTYFTLTRPPSWS